MKKIALSVCAVVIVALAAINLNLVFNSEPIANLSLQSIVSLAQGESENGGGYAEVGLRDIGKCTDCRDGMEYLCDQAQVFCEGTGSLQALDQCGSTRWGNCQRTGNLCSWGR